jgi:hypothetical protein
VDHSILLVHDPGRICSGIEIVGRALGRLDTYVHGAVVDKVVAGTGEVVVGTVVVVAAGTAGMLEEVAVVGTAGTVAVVVAVVVADGRDSLDSWEKHDDHVAMMVAT